MTTERPRDFAPALPFPNPGDWATLTDAAAMLGVSRQSVNRMADDGILTRYEIGTEDNGRQSLYWRAEVAELAAARARVRGPVQG